MIKSTYESHVLRVLFVQTRRGREGGGGGGRGERGEKKRRILLLFLLDLFRSSFIFFFYSWTVLCLFVFCVPFFPVFFSCLSVRWQRVDTAMCFCFFCLFGSLLLFFYVVTWYLAFFLVCFVFVFYC